MTATTTGLLNQSLQAVEGSIGQLDALLTQQNQLIAQNNEFLNDPFSPPETLLQEAQLGVTERTVDFFQQLAQQDVSGVSAGAAGLALSRLDRQTAAQNELVRLETDRQRIIAEQQARIQNQQISVAGAQQILDARQQQVTTAQDQIGISQAERRLDIQQQQANNQLRDINARINQQAYQRDQAKGLNEGNIRMLSILDKYAPVPQNATIEDLEKAEAEALAALQNIDTSTAYGQGLAAAIGQFARDINATESVLISNQNTSQQNSIESSLTNLGVTTTANESFTGGTGADTRVVSNTQDNLNEIASQQSITLNTMETVQQQQRQTPTLTPRLEFGDILGRF